MRKRICYIINPKSGAKGKAKLPRQIERLSDKGLVDFEIVYTKAPKHATELSRRAAQNGCNIVVAIGGDGSVNEVAKGLIGSGAALGIIPTGSGNGMARHLKIPLKHSEAIQTINRGHAEIIDTLSVNNDFCIGTVGIGFDGHVAHLFANAGKRGYTTYIKLVLSEFYKYKPKVFDFSVDSKAMAKECFLLTFANSSQFGNNAVIAPWADVQDGTLDVSMIGKFPMISAPHLIYRLMKNTIQKSKFFEMMQGQEVIVRNSGILHGHIDGEPVTFNGDLTVKVVPKSLNVIVPGAL